MFVCLFIYSDLQYDFAPFGQKKQNKNYGTKNGMEKILRGLNVQTKIGASTAENSNEFTIFNVSQSRTHYTFGT